MKEYLFCYDGSKACQDMKKFLDSKGLEYNLIHTEEEPCIFDPSSIYPYKSKDFADFKAQFDD
jgi:hypothetical protein